MIDMAIKKHKIDYDTVQRRYPSGRYISVGKTECDRYRPAYLITNEHLDDFICPADVRGRDVLTVAASGDQPMLFAACGAGRVDTFDMTYSAKVIMDLKVSALGHIDRMQYLKMMVDLRKSQEQNTDIMDIRGVEKIIETMPHDSAEFLRRMSNAEIFSEGVKVIAPYRLTRHPSLWQYNRMQRVVKEPFNFIWTDISHLTHRVTEKYDIVNISNILEWIGDARVAPTLGRLFGVLRPGGYIQATYFEPGTRAEVMFRLAANELGDIARVQSVWTPHEIVLRLYRVR